jgi:putative ABC transport system permease protein
VRAIVESQGRVLGTIRWLLVSLTALILVIVALCVMATMTAIVLERKKDVAVMKALGATDRLILRLFLCEGAGMGLTGGLLGFGLGLLLARELGLRLFGVPIEPAWWTLPLIGLGSGALTVVATLFPVRLAQSVQPATALKGV